MTPLRSGDVVLHRPSGEKWVLAYAEGEEVSACGWPFSIARAADCDLVKAATDEQHIAMLASWGDEEHRNDRGALDWRHVVCKRQLAELRGRR